MTDLRQAGPGPSSSNDLIEYGKQSTRMLQTILHKMTPTNKFNFQSRTKGMSKVSCLTGYLSCSLEDAQAVQSSGIEQTVDRLAIHYDIIDYYIKGHHVPTTTSLYSTLANKLPRYVDISIFRNILVQMGYMWKKCGPNVWLVLEKPNVTFERYLYMKAITRSRSGAVCYVGGGAVLQNGRIVEIDESDTLRISEDRIPFLFAVRENSIEFFEHVDSFSKWIDWFVQTVIPELKPGTTVVFENSRHFKKKICEAPTIESLKIDMMQWLDHHKVPYNDTMSRVELYSLALKMTDVNANLVVADNLLLGRGCQALHIVTCVDRVIPTNIIKRFIETHSNYSDVAGLGSQSLLDNLRSTLNSITPEVIQEIHELVKNEEHKIISYDHLLEEVWDNVMSFMDKCKTMKDKATEIDNFLPTCNPYE